MYWLCFGSDCASMADWHLHSWPKSMHHKRKLWIYVDDLTENLVSATKYATNDVTKASILSDNGIQIRSKMEFFDNSRLWCHFYYFLAFKRLLSQPPGQLHLFPIFYSLALALTCHIECKQKYDDLWPFVIRYRSSDDLCLNGGKYLPPAVNRPDQLEP